MPALEIRVDGEGALEEYADRLKGQGEIFMITGLEGGMASGAPSVSVTVKLRNGDLYFAETSLKLFLTAADALRARYGDPRSDGP